MLRKLIKLSFNTKFNYIGIACFSKTRSNYNYLKDTSKTSSEILGNLIEQDKERLHTIKELFKQNIETGLVADFQLTDDDLLECLILNNSECLRYFRTLNRRYMRQFKKKTKDTPISYEGKSDVGVGLYIKDNLKSLQRQRMINSILLDSQKIIIDMGFEDMMTRLENRKTVQQIYTLIGSIYKVKDPFQMVLSNCDPYSQTYKLLNEKCSKYNYYLENHPLSFSHLDFDNIFPDENKNIIYLSPDSDRELVQGEYDRNATFVIGGIVDKVTNYRNASLNKARKRGLKHAKLPIDRAVKWVQGKKTLTLTSIVDILYQARATNGDWHYAIRSGVAPRLISS